MTADNRPTQEVALLTDCGYCGHRRDGEATPIERFGEPFCSEAHAEQFAEGVRIARIDAAARHAAAGNTCSLPPPEQRTWKGTLKRGACWGAPLLLLLALPLFWSGTALGATGGSLLSLLAVLACPLGMYCVMRAMGGMSHEQRPSGPADDRLKAG